MQAGICAPLACVLLSMTAVSFISAAIAGRYFGEAALAAVNATGYSPCAAAVEPGPNACRH